MIPNSLFVSPTTAVAAKARGLMDWNLKATGVGSAFEPSVALPGGSGALCLSCPRCR